MNLARPWILRLNTVGRGQTNYRHTFTFVPLDLFERLRALRGTKTMIFSTHRFGYLTKHADVILCVNSVVSRAIL